MHNNNTKARIFFSLLKKELSIWLEKELSCVDVFFYNDIVLSGLRSDYFRQRLESVSLSSFDLPLLLFVARRNWNLINKNKSFQYHAQYIFIVVERFYNRILNCDENLKIFPNERAAIIVLLKTISASPELRSLFLAAFSDVAPYQKESSCEEKGRQDSGNSIESDLKVSDLVCLKSEPTKRGVVLAIDGFKVSVFVDGAPQFFYVDQITKILQEEARFIPLEMARKRITAFLLKHPVANSLYSLKAARIDAIPYQYKPVLKIIQSEQPRLLIADGVGLGKTIEAGLILRELEVRNNVQSVLVICPKPLVAEKKWSQELKRFDEEFDTLDSQTLQYCLDESDKEGEWPSKRNKVILPYSLCDARLLDRLNHLNPMPKFDMVIVDEAHHIRNSSTQKYQVVEKFCDNAEAVVFLTATPLQIGNRDLYTLLHCLSPSFVTDEETFSDLQEPNEYITKACRLVKAGQYKDARSQLEGIRKLAAGHFVISNALYEPTLRLLEKNNPTNEEIVSLVDNIRALHTFDSLINRTLRKDVSADFCVRHPKTIRVSFTDEEQQVYSTFLEIQAGILSNIHGIDNVRFMMNMLERQASSSIHGLAPFIKDMLTRSLSEDDYLELDDEEDTDFTELPIKEYSDKIEDLGRLARVLSEKDPKYEALQKVINDKQVLGNHKVIVFSTFRHTLSYLAYRLHSEGRRIGLIHGGIPDSERRSLRNRFAKHPDEQDAIDVMLFSEVGCEGLDYQFCDTIINYDLPWNPMKIEQRIGRIDRFGQKSEAVAIYNIIVSKTVDADIYERCLKRIGIFESSIGDCDEILGEIYSQIKSVCEDISLSADQRREKLEQVALNECRKLKQQQEMEKQQSALFTMPSEFSNHHSLQDYENVWVSPESLEELTSEFLREKTNATNPIVGVSENQRKLRLPQEAKSILWKDYLKINGKRCKDFRKWENYLRSTEPYAPLSFFPDEAVQNLEAQFIMPMHPLVRMAGDYFYSDVKCLTQIKVVSDFLPEGDFPFELYAWDYKGIRPKIELKAFCDNPAIQESLLELIWSGAEAKEKEVTLPSGFDMKVRETWLEERSQYKEEERRVALLQIQSLAMSSNARRRAALARTKGKGVERIRENWLRKIDLEEEARRSEILNSIEHADIVCHELISGILTVYRSV